MVTAPTSGEVGVGVKTTVPVYEGTATRADVTTKEGIVKGGVTYATPVDMDRIEDGNCYVKDYTTWNDAVTPVAAADIGTDITGRLIDIDKNVPEISANGGTQAATRANARRGTYERFVPGQIIRVRANGSSVAIAVNDKLSLDTASTYIFKKDATNGRFRALEATTDADAYILARVVA